MKMLSFGKKGQILGQMSGLVTALVTIAIVLAVGFLILAEISTNDSVVADGNATSAVDDTTSAMATIPDFLDIIVITVIGALLLGLVRFFRS